eukprot:419554-Rhodomonas_salina.1
MPFHEYAALAETQTRKACPAQKPVHARLSTCERRAISGSIAAINGSTADRNASIPTKQKKEKKRGEKGKKNGAMDGRQTGSVVVPHVHADAEARAWSCLRTPGQLALSSCGFAVSS